MKSNFSPFKALPLLSLLVFFLTNAHMLSAQRTALQARHETDNQNSTTIRLNGNLAALYNTTAGWSVTVGGSAVTISTVIGASGSPDVTITWPVGQAVGIGQAVVVNFAGDAAINSITAMASLNNRTVVCSDFTWESTGVPTPPCAPVSPQTKMVFRVKRGGRNSSNWNLTNIKVRAYWMNVGVAPFNQMQAFESDNSGSASPNSYFVAVDASTSGYEYPGNEDVCGYQSEWRVRIIGGGGFDCGLTDPGQQVIYASHNTDADGEGDGELILEPTDPGTDEVCEGQFVDMSFSDVSDLNCIDTDAAPNPIPINDDERWVRIIYGLPHDPGNTIRNVFIGGEQVTDSDGNLMPAYATGYIPLTANALGTPDAFGVVSFPASVEDAAGELEEITTSTATLEGDAGRTFNITMQYWNVCNEYTFGNFANARSITDQVIVINAPEAPTFSPDPAVFCNNATDATYNFTASGTGTGTFNWYADAALTAPAEKTGASFNPVTEGTPAVSKTTAGNYTYYVTETLGNGCVSPATPVNFTIRNALGQPPAFTGSTDVCPNTTYTWTVPVAPATETFGGATEYVWTYPGAWTFVSQTATSITLTTDGTVGASTLSVRRRYVNTPNCQSNARNVTINIRANPTASITPDPISICQGSALQINGNPTNPFGTIASHVWTDDIAILNDASIQQPTISAATAPGTYNLTYTVTNSIGCSGSDNISVLVSANPTLANAGTDQPLCQVSLTSNPIGASNPAPGTGTWTIQSKPAGSNVVFNGGVNDRNATITVDQNGAYTLRWTVVNGACTSFDDVIIDFGTDPGPQDAGTAGPFCGLTGTLNATAPTVGTISWAQFSGPGSTTFTPAAPTTVNPGVTVTVAGTYVYRMTVTSGTCAIRTDDVSVTFNPPATSTPAANFITCVDPTVLAPINLTGTVGGGATGGRWERVSAGAGTIGSSGTNVGNNFMGTTINDTYVPTVAEVTTGSIQVRLVATGATAPCGEISTTRTITLDRRPTGVDAGAAQALLCADPVTGRGSATLSASALNTGETGVWSAPVVVPAITFGNINSPISTVSNLPGGVTTTLTWTVRSPQFGNAGSCAGVPDQVDLTVNVLPAANNPAPANLCEIVEASGVALGVNLTQYNDGVTGIAGSGDRTIEWYHTLPRNAGNMIGTPTSFDVSNGQTLYTRVHNTITNCFRDGIVTFTINPLPNASDRTFEFCEEFPAGSDQVQNINLTAPAIINPITGGVGDRTVVWFNSLADANGNTNAIPNGTATSYDVLNGSETIYARVTNTLTSCVNVAEVQLVVKPRPADPVITGSENQCLDGFDLYSVTPVAGVTYIWDVDDNAATEFDVISGGLPTDFLVVVSFPNVYSGDISLTLDRNGCLSNQITKTVTVEATPPDVTITASKDPVCENDGGIVFTATSLPLTDYAWEIPVVNGATGSSIIGGQGFNQVTVNIGAISGNIKVTPQTRGGSCAGDEATFFIDVRERPELDTYPITPVCSDEAIEITLQEAAGSVVPDSYEITNVTVAPGLNPSSRALATGDATLIFNDSYTNVGNGNTQLDVRYTIVPISVEGCEGSPKDITVRIRPEPIINPNLDRTVCSRDAGNIVLQVASNSAPANEFEITSIQNNAGLTALAGNPTTGTFLPNELVDDVWENLTGARDTIKYFIRPINTTTGCIGDPPYPVLLIVNPEPEITSPIADVICSGDMPTITLTSSIMGSTFDWSVSNISGLIVGGNSGSGNTISNVLTNNDVSSGTITYEVISTGPGGAFGTCESQPVDVTITVNPAPTSINVDQIVCSDAGGVTFEEDLQSLESSINGSGTVTFTWYEDLGMTQQINAPQLNAWPLANDIPVYVDIFNGQCRILHPVKYTVNPTPVVTASITSNFNGGFNVSCAGSSNGQITSDPATSGTGPNYLYSVDGGTSFFTSRVFNGLSAVNNPFVITVRDTKGCTAESDPMTLLEPPALTSALAISSDFNGRDVTCPGAPDGEITVSPTGGVAPFTYQILELPSNTTGNATGVYTGLRAGTYTVFIRDANTICTSTTNTVTIVDPPMISATATLADAVSCNGVSDGEISITASGGTLINPDYTYTLVQSPFTSNGTGDFSGLAAGPYSVTVEDDNNCSQTSNIVIVTQPASLVAFASVTSNYHGSKISCPGADDGIITVTPNGGNGGYTFELVEDNANTSGDGSGVYGDLAPGSYTVTVTDTENCTITTVAVSLSDPQPITPASAITGAITCNGDTDGEITISANGGTSTISFTRISGPGSPDVSATGIFPGLGQGTYDFEVSDANACTAPIQVILNEPTDVVASAAVTSDYSGSQTTCTTSSDGAITVTANGGTGAYHYIFDQQTGNVTGETSGVFIGIGGGTGYTFTVADANGCDVQTLPVDIVPPTNVTVTSASVTSDYHGQEISCVGATDGEITIIVTGGTTTTPGEYTYRLDQEPLNVSGNLTGVYTGVSVGSYTVTVRDVNNCFVVTVPIDIDPYPVITVPASVTSVFNGGRQISCNGEDDGEITVLPSGGVGPFTFVLDTDPANISGENSGVFTGLVAGTYTITASDQNSCPRTTSSIVITEPALLTASAAVTSNYNGRQVSCFGENDGIITTSAAGGTVAYGYVLNEISGNTTGAASGVFADVPAGISYTITITDVNGCNTTTAPISVTEPLALAISGDVSSNYNGQDISCNGADDAIITVTFTAGTGTGTPVYAFDNYSAPGNVTGHFSGIFTGVEPNAGYTITATDVNGCTAQTLSIPVLEPPALGGASNATSNFSGFDVSCFNETDGEITVTPTGGTGDPLVNFKYLLLEASSNTTGEIDGTFDGLRAGSYRARITDQNGCTFITPAIPVTQPTDISINIDITSNYGATGADLSCADATDGEISVRATISGGAGIVGGGPGSGISDYTYVLDQDPGNIDAGDNGVFTGLDNILYTVTATDANGCEKQSLPVVLIDPLPLFEGIIGMDKSICLGDDPTAFTELAAVFGGTGDYSYQWQDSIVGGNYANIMGATNATYDAPAPGVVETRFYRRLVSSGTGVSCPTLESGLVKVQVNALPEATFIANPNPVCEGGFTILEFQFTGSAPFFFDYDDGTTFEDDRIGVNATPVFFSNLQNTTTYSITELHDINGCYAVTLPAPVVVPVINIDNNFSIVGPDSQCAGGEFEFEWDVDTDVQYTWTFGSDVIVVGPNDPAYPPGLNTISIIRNDISTSGTITIPIVLEAESTVLAGCKEIPRLDDVKVFPSVMDNISPVDTIICSAQSVKFINQSQGASTNLWSYKVKGSADAPTQLSDVSPLIQFMNTTASNPLIYEVAYLGTNTNSCFADDTVDIYVFKGITADFTFNPPNPEYIGGQTPITYTNISNPIDDGIFRYEWNFGSNSTPGTQTGSGPIWNVNYSSPGTKTVVLRAVNLAAEAAGENCVTIESKAIIIDVPDFSAEFNIPVKTDCSPLTITTENTSGAADEFVWILRNVQHPDDTVSLSTLLEPTFIIAEPGEYDLVLVASLDALGLQETFVVDGIKVYEHPMAIFNPRPSTGFTDTNFEFRGDQSFRPADPITNVVYPMDFYWDFEDNATSTIENTFYKFDLEGIYDVELRVENVHDDGVVCKDSISRQVNVKSGSETSIPNAFTPDPSGPNDGRVYANNGKFNDVFLPMTTGVVDGGFLMQVFDRWGNLVFESRDKEVGWNGYDRNKNLLPAGVYVYKLQLEFDDGRRTTQIGDITMIR